MIEAQGLFRHYRSAPVVDDLSVGVRSGTVTGLLGPNGAGKPNLGEAKGGLRDRTVAGDRLALRGPAPCRGC